MFEVLLLSERQKKALLILWDRYTRHRRKKKRDALILSTLLRVPERKKERERERERKKRRKKKKKRGG